MIHSFKNSFSKPLLMFLLLAVFPAFLISCTSTKATQGKTDTLPQALLWKIEHQDLAKPSYLFGTIHMIPRSDFFLPVGLDEAFDACDRVVFEIDLDDMNDMGALMGMFTNLPMKNGVTLDELLTPEEYQEVSDYFKDMGLPMFLLNQVKPMFLSMLAEVNMDPAEMQSDEIVSYEMELYVQAQSASKKVGGLETMAYQVSLFDSIPYTDQAYMLLDAVRGTQLESDMFEETIALYKQQDIEGMVQMVGEMEDNPASRFEQILLINRNENWIPSMAKKMSTGPVFFAVGAGHLGGEKGVIRLLKNAGYILSPVSIYKPVAPRRL